MATSVAAVAGLEEAGPAALRKLGSLASSRGWDADGLAAAIALESRWNPTARNSAGCVGLLQFCPVVLRSWGLSPETVLAMSAQRQLDLVERYFGAWLSRGYTIGPRDWTAFALGAGNARPTDGPLPDETVLYEPGSPGARGNPAIQDEDGAITMASARAALGRVLAGAGGRRLPIPSASVATAGAGLGGLAAALALATMLHRRRRVRV